MAEAIHTDTYAGPCSATVVAWRTKLRGEAVTLYRWQRDDGVSIVCFRSGFFTVAQAVKAAKWHAAFSRVEG